MEEWFDVVDVHGKVIERTLRSNVHSLHLLLRSAHILVFNHAGEVFLWKRSLRKHNLPGLLDSSAVDHLASSKDCRSAVAHELIEELGITSMPIGH